MLLLTLALCAAELHGAPIHNNSPAPTISDDRLLAMLRRQLMDNNYDYQSVEQLRVEQRAHSTPAGPGSSAASAGGRFHVVQARSEREGGAQILQPFENNKLSEQAPQYSGQEFKLHDSVVGLDAQSLRSRNEPQFRSKISEANFGDDPKPDHVVSKNDLLYYVDENRFRRSQTNSAEEAALDKPDFEEAYSYDDIATTPKVKYKLFKVGGRAPSRRHGQRAPRFLQERGATGVAIISLDAAPFPQFRLPRARRQYMRRARASASHQRDLAPPSDTPQR